MGELSDPEICGQGKLIRFVTSSKMRTEVLATKDEVKRSLLSFATALIENTEWIAHERIIPPVFGARVFGQGVMGGPYRAIDPIFRDLCQIFDRDDAMHVFQAHSSQCEVFLTLDTKTILRPAKLKSGQLATIGLTLTFCAPSELLTIATQS